MCSIPVRDKNSLSYKTSRPVPGPTEPPIQLVWGFPSLEVSGRCVKLTVQPPFRKWVEL